jgi:hypothetical protein
MTGGGGKTSSENSGEPSALQELQSSSKVACTLPPDGEGSGRTIDLSQLL